MKENRFSKNPSARKVLKNLLTKIILYGKKYFRTLRKLHKLISVSLTNLLCILGSGTRPLTPSPCHVIFPIQNPAQSRHKYSYLRILGNTSDKEGKDTTTLIFPPLHAPA